MNHQALSSFIWSVADLLRGDYKQSEYGRVILPFTVLRRLDCVLEGTKEAVLKEYAAKKSGAINAEPFLLRAAQQSFYNTSELDFKKLLGDQDHIRENLDAYIQGFSASAKDIFERFSFFTQVDKLQNSNLLYLITEKFANIDLHPQRVSNQQMGLVFEELIRKFSELSNETAGEHFTPRDAIRLMVNLLFIEDDEMLTGGKAVVRTIYDPAAGTGGMLSLAEEHLLEHNPSARLTTYGQELNDESYAICKADMLIKGQDVANIVPGNTLSDDGHSGKRFDYMLSNPPYGVEWKKVEKARRSALVERDLHDLIEKHMECFLGIRLVAHEYSTGKNHRGRIDSLGLDENCCPVIIEYKRQTNENVINQGLYYLDWLLDHQAEFQLRVMEHFGKDIADAIEWNGTRVLCVAGDFTKFDEHAVAQIGRNIELIRYKYFSGDLLMLEWINPVQAKPQTAEQEVAVESSVKQPLKKETTFSENLAALSGDFKQLYDDVFAYITTLGDDINAKTVKYYMAFSRLKNFTCLAIFPQEPHMKLWLKLKPEDIPEEKGFIRHVHKTGHWGTGDVEVIIRDAASFVKTPGLS